MTANFRRIRTIARQDLGYLLRDPVVAITLVVMPLLVTAFVGPMLGQALNSEGFEGASGAEQAIPGTAVMFSFLVISFLGYAVFREHGWNTWDRLRTTGCTRANVYLGKAVPALIVVVGQKILLFAVSALIFGLSITNALQLLAVAVAFALCLVSLAWAIAVLGRTVQQVGAISNLCTIVLGGLGGALAPPELLPGWAQAVARFTPGYWAVGAYRSILLGEADWTQLKKPIVILLVMTTCLVLVVIRRFRLDEQKIAWG